MLILRLVTGVRRWVVSHLPSYWVGVPNNIDCITIRWDDMFAMNINSTFFAIIHLSLFNRFFYSYFYLICYFITGGIQNVQCKPNVNTLMTLVCNGGSRSSSIYIYNDLLFYIIHSIFDNLFCTNIQGRQVFSKRVPRY